MSDVSDLMEEGLLDLESSLGATIIWAGKLYPIIPSSAKRGKDLAEGGFKLHSDLSFVARCSVFPTPGPALKNRIIYLGDTYRIDSIEKTPGEAFLRFECNDPAQGV